MFEGNEYYHQSRSKKFQKSRKTYIKELTNGRNKLKKSIQKTKRNPIH